MGPSLDELLVSNRRSIDAWIVTFETGLNQILSARACKKPRVMRGYQSSLSI
ncbi:hypothetical protein TERTU_2804 [Teredinibacter turnerae T7901]|uniref:Uncharacterized protein n=1 Tax=Teredinibacter turnerae (strain ATCC 39867 / T7901) TaxID=377629 RepID=C5BMP7_TERTT|nr:hypothetical protein TERTU_2804 [Teredinibacter turnerae T7901]